MRSLILTVLVASTLVSRADAQSEPPAGVRATGMGGAFVAVADDASAVFWNPAGLASGSYFSLALDDNRLQTADNTSFPHRRSAFMVAIGAPALGLSYFSTTVTRATRAQLLPGTGGHTDVFLERLAARQVGATLVQSLGRRVAVGATVKVVRGSASTGLVDAGDSSAFDNFEELFPARATTKFDSDIGLMVSSRVAKAGIAVRNMIEPKFATSDGAAITLERRIRGGVSLLLLQTVTLAADVDLTKGSTSFGEWRDAAIGAELRPGRRTWVRGGIHWNTAGGTSGPGAAPIGSLGGSYAVYGSVLADGQVSFGSENGDQGWGVGLRFVF
jgi:hypothetical protein